MGIPFNYFVRIPRKNILIILVLLITGGMLGYAPSANAANISCEVMPFSKVITAGASVNYTVDVTSDILYIVVQLKFGDFPSGVSGSFVSVSFVTTPGTLSFTVNTGKTAQVGSFSLVILDDASDNVICQYALEILSPLPAGAGTDKEGSLQKWQLQLNLKKYLRRDHRKLKLSRLSGRKRQLYLSFNPISSLVRAGTALSLSRTS